MLCCLLSAKVSNAIALRSIAKRKSASFRTVTPRERQVMTLVVSGLLNKEIGGELGISEITVKAHRGRVMRRRLK